MILQWVECVGEGAKEEEVVIMLLIISNMELMYKITQYR